MSLRELIEKAQHESHEHSDSCWTMVYNEEGDQEEYLSCTLLAGHYESQCLRCQLETALHAHDAELAAIVRAKVVEEIAKHQAHYIFSPADGKIVSASCACRVKFDPSEAGCPQWERHILALAPMTDSPNPLPIGTVIPRWGRIVKYGPAYWIVAEGDTKATAVDAGLIEALANSNEKENPDGQPPAQEAI